MTADDRISAIRERLAKATPCPWRWEFETEGEARRKRRAEGSDAYIGHEYKGAVLHGEGKPVLNCSGDCSDEAWGPTEHDAALIAHAPIDLAWLLKRVEILEQFLSAYRRHYRLDGGNMETYVALQKTLKALDADTP